MNFLGEMVDIVDIRVHVFAVPISSTGFYDVGTPRKHRYVIIHPQPPTPSKIFDSATVTNFSFLLFAPW